MNWDTYFIILADLVSKKSKDRSVKIGVVIVGPDHEIRSTGFNGFPRGIDDSEEKYHERPLKYQITEHGERNAIYNAARIGISLKECTMYMNFEPIPCTDCARGVIQSGITKIVGPDIKFEGKGEQWEKDLQVANEMIQAVGIEQVWINNE